MHKHMRRRLSPEGLDMRDGTPENRVPELLARAGLPVPAPPFAQRAATIPDANPLAKLHMKKGCARPVQLLRIRQKGFAS